MSKEMIGRRVAVKSMGTIDDYDELDGTYHILIDNGVEGWFGDAYNDELDIQREALPTAIGSVIKVTKWFSSSRAPWSAVFIGGRWHHSIDGVIDSSSGYSTDAMETSSANGNLEFEVIYDPSKEDSK